MNEQSGTITVTFLCSESGGGTAVRLETRSGITVGEFLEEQGITDLDRYIIRRRFKNEAGRMETTEAVHNDVLNNHDFISAVPAKSPAG